MEKRFPLRLLLWETTAACNLRCGHCRRRQMNYEASPGELSTGEAKNLLSELTELNNPLVIFSGGEPLMRPDIVELATFAVDHGLKVALATNGTLVNETVASELKRAGVRRVSVSVDGATSQTHERIRGFPGSFESALNALRILKAAGLNTQINMTVCRGNRSEVDRLFQLGLEEGVDSVHLFIVVPVGCGFTYAQDQVLSADEIEELMNWFYQHAGQLKVESRLTCAPQYQRFLIEKGGVRKDSPSGCLGGKSVCFVSCRGDVFPCGYLPLAAGNIRNQDFRDIWDRSEIFQRLRDPHNLSGTCGACEHRGICGGCRARAYAATGDYLEADTCCVGPDRE